MLENSAKKKVTKLSKNWSQPKTKGTAIRQNDRVFGHVLPLFRKKIHYVLDVEETYI